MLILPDDWRQCTAESSARAMLRQANEIGEYRVAARLLTRACFELLRDTLWGDVHDGGPVIHFEEQVIRVNDYAYLVADADDSAIDQAMALSERVHEVCVLTPPDVRVLMGEAMKSLQRKNVTVQSLDSYVGLRVMLTELDTRANGPAVFADLLLRYANLCERFGETRVEVTRDGLRPLSREQVEQSRRRSAERRLANDLGPVAKATSAPGTSRAASKRSMQTCQLCSSKWDSEDGWDGLCPECADLVSNLLDELELTDDDCDDIVERLQAVVQRALSARR